MAITIEQLDNEYVQENISILVGKNFILKFIPQKSAFDSSDGLQKLISTTDLLVSSLNTKVRVLVGKSRHVSDLIGGSIKLREIYNKEITVNSGGIDVGISEPLVKYLSNKLEEQRNKILKEGAEIKKIEKEAGLFLAQDNNLYFCEKCHAYLGDSFESLPDNCLSCNQVTDWEDSQKITTIRFLDNKVLQYLDGLWFEDYIAKLLNKLGWKTWCHGLIMGSSGIAHQVDILAINTTDGRVLIGECKTAKIEKKHIFDLSAQFYDIKSSSGFMFSFDPVSNDRLTEYMKRTAGLYLLDNLKANSDDEIIEKIKKFI